MVSKNTTESHKHSQSSHLENITPSKWECAGWKQRLYDSLMHIATERHEFRPRKADSLSSLMESYFDWAETYNDGYFKEMRDATWSRYCAWLTQEYEKYVGGIYGES